ncbi:hypothetical protein [Pseudochryseolinea flava]|uniref:Uncharacterized protein n=1 Tax=Pseudochryseolinea flava TaxID=2059302 RepID=A0A364Y0H6_9BACT|nr:hypothetical protein [Pseudochryseolinea flava]RAW00091.1 hypothetical protein DQQ10_16205 [Pseudochryseolinea flava]
MQKSLNLIEETLSHFSEGAKSVRAYSPTTTYIITKINDEGEFWITLEEPGFPKSRAKGLEQYFSEVYGIEAVY